MWMMTKIGFYSIVEKDNKICIRSRKKQDLRKFSELIPGCGPIIKTKLADYRYRIFMSKELFEKEFYRLAQLVTYNNFKNEVKKTNTRRELLYYRVWMLLLDIEREGMQEPQPVEPKELAANFMSEQEYKDNLQVLNDSRMYEEAESMYLQED
jgi:hypothetical protein